MNNTIRFKLNGDVWKLPAKSGYSPQFAESFTTTNIDGGLALSRAVSRSVPINITATYELGSALEIQRFNMFYYDEIQEGSLPFEAKLDVMGSPAVYDCQIVGELSTSGWTGEYTAVTLPLQVNVPIDQPTLEAQYEINKMIRS